MASPRGIDPDLVDAQQARRVLDRLVGYKVSPLLWKKVKRGLSAGRVQTAALRIVAEREREIQAFEPVEYWSIDAELAKQTGAEPRPKDIFRAGLQRVQGKKITLDNAEQTDGRPGRTGRSALSRGRRHSQGSAAPAIPTLHDEHTSTGGFAQARLRRSPHHADRAGALRRGRSWRTGDAGSDHLHADRFDECRVLGASSPRETRSRVSYGPELRARAATRLLAEGERRSGGTRGDPTDGAAPGPGEREAVPVRAAVPALSAHLAAVHRLTDASGGPRSDRGRRRGRARRGDLASGRPALPVPCDGLGREVPRVHGRLPGRTGRGRRGGRAGEGSAAAAGPGEDLDLLQLLPEQHFTQPPPRFTEASLVKALEEQGIGRPSTYAPTIATIQARGYVATEEKKLAATELGLIVNDLLVEHFPRVFDVGFTSQMEEELDEIASGDRAWVPTLHEFYGPVCRDAGPRRADDGARPAEG